MSWKPIYGLLIFALTLGNFMLARIISMSTSKTRRKLFLILAITSDILVLAYFKYAYFLYDLVNHSLQCIGFGLPPLTYKIILPLGISFFVFEFIHYIVDVYKGSKPVQSFFDFALFASFFPTQIAGPIKRYQDFVPQLAKPLPLTLTSLEESITYILKGLVKKVLFADYLAIVVHSAFEHPELLSNLDLWLSVYAFAFQIYFDFSGYTDIARGSALLLGFKVPPNFDLPYLASSISEFWRRWHISLSTWLRDYLFIPLGGSKGNIFSTYRNLLITMVLGGIWHGAAMHFVFWGIYQGILLVINKEFQRLSEHLVWLKQIRQWKLFHYFSIVFTFHCVCIGWVLFRAETISGAINIIRKLLFLGPAMSAQAANIANPWCLTITSTSESTVFLLLPLILITLFVGQVIVLKRQKNFLLSLDLPKWARAVNYALAIGALIILSPDYAPKFIYFQF